MPYKVVSESGKFKVYKLGADNKPSGKPLGTHNEKPKADAQVRALYANEKKPKKEMGYSFDNGAPEAFTVSSGDSITHTVTDSKGNTTTTQKPMQVDEDETKDYYGNPVEVVLVESTYGPLTFADLLAEEEAREAVYEMQELNYKLQRLITNIMNSDTEDKAGALVALTNEYAALVQKEVQDSEDKATSIAKQIAGDNQPKPEIKEESPVVVSDDKSLFIWKEDNTYRWLAAYSNNRRDEDNPPEIISSESHKEFDEALNKGEWPMPELWVWHVPMAVGQTLFHAYDESKGFPIAGGIFNKGFEWVAEGLASVGWDGVSHGMPSDWIQRDKDDATIITRHRTKEVSILPNWAAANKLAFTIISKESNMADETKDLPQHKREQLVAAFGEDKAKLFEDALAGKAKEADEAGIEQKEAPVEEKMLTQSDLLKALEYVSDGIKASFEKLDARLKAIEESQVEEKDKFDIVEVLKAKSIIGKEAAKIDGRSSLAKDAPKEAEQETPTAVSTGGVPIGLVDGLFQLNQGWYNREGEQR